MSNVSAIVEEHVQASKNIEHLRSDPDNLNMDDLGHSEEVETMTIEAMDVDVQVRIAIYLGFISIIFLFLKF